MTILEDLQWRGLIADCTHPEELTKLLSEGPITLYAGFDPTADSLHVGSLVPLLALRRFQLAGHKPMALAGGATGSIGDPGGRSKERNLLSKEVLSSNIAKVKDQLQRLLDFDSALPNHASLLDNASWMAPISFLDFLRDVGKHFTVNMMVAKESVRARMEDRSTGISYTEFSYMLLQAYDFYHLQQTVNCQLQIGGSDQWGNITAGIDLCHKKAGKQVFGLTLPLITNSDGSKFGKSVSGAIWLDPKRTSPYRFYQYFIQTDDKDVIRYLRFFTFLSKEQIEELEKAHTERPESRVAHKALAEAMTTLIHGEEATHEAIVASDILFGGEMAGISESAFHDVAAEIPSKELRQSDLEGEGLGLIDLMIAAELTHSKGQARKDITGGGSYVNNVRQSDPFYKISTSDLLFGKYLLLRKGKRNYVLVTFS
ncbi:MAG: tyrosine--tRNA ligase [Opitutaceae bacterium]|nr:tyrosine--tRNA ligase [Opitutaceae bacterium]